MANRIISSLPASPDDAEVRRDDQVAVLRGGVTYKALFSGQYTVPQSTGADSGKALMVDASGSPAWQNITDEDVTINGAVRETLWDSGLTLDSDDSDETSIDSGKLFGDYADLEFTFSMTDDNLATAEIITTSIPVPAFHTTSWLVVNGLDIDARAAVKKAGAGDNEFVATVRGGGSDSPVIRLTHIHGIKR